MKSFHKIQHIYFILAIILFSGTEAAWSESTDALEEILVTAQKRVENLQSVPISVTALTGERMDDIHAVNLESLKGYVPNFQVQPFTNTPHGAVFNIRGMGVIEPDPFAGTTVTVVVDGVPQFFNMTALLDTYDLERVEVLRGPQGTLFGANSTGGVVNVTTRQPTGEFGGTAEVTIGNHDRMDFKGAVDFPITEQLAGKVTASHHNRDGWITNVVDGNDMGSKDVTAFRGYLRFDNDDGFDSTLIAEYVRARDGAAIVVNGSLPGEVTYTPAGTFGTDPGSLLPQYPGVCPAVGRCKAPDEYFSANNSTIDLSDMNTYALTWTNNWTAWSGDWTSITGWKDYDLHEYTDQDGTVNFIDDTERLTEGWQFTQEIRGAFQPTDALDLMVGFYYITNNYTHIQNFRIPFGGPGLRQFNWSEQDNWSASVFVNGTFQMTEDLTLRAGIRYTDEETEMDVFLDTLIFSTGYYDGDSLGAFTSHGKDSWDNVGGQLGLDYQINEDVMGYFSYKRGFKSGGFVGRISTPADIGPYDPEYVDSIEFGVKSDLLDHRLRANVAVFYSWYDDMQLAQIFFCEDDFGNTVNCNSILNAASAEIGGFELELTAIPTAGLVLNAAVGYLDAEYQEFLFNGVTDLSGESLQNAPKWTLNTGLNYTRQTGSGEANFNVQYKYTDKKFNTNLENTPRSEIQPTHIVDANLSWTPNDGSWTVSLWATNLFDNRYIASVFDAPGFIGLVNLHAPREWGASFRYNW